MNTYNLVSPCPPLGSNTDLTRVKFLAKILLRALYFEAHEVAEGVGAALGRGGQ